MWGSFQYIPDRQLDNFYLNDFWEPVVRKKINAPEHWFPLLRWLRHCCFLWHCFYMTFCFEKENTSFLSFPFCCQTFRVFIESMRYESIISLPYNSFSLGSHALFPGLNRTWLLFLGRHLTLPQGRYFLSPGGKTFDLKSAWDVELLRKLQDCFIIITRCVGKVSDLWPKNELFGPLASNSPMRMLD